MQYIHTWAHRWRLVTLVLLVFTAVFGLSDLRPVRSQSPVRIMPLGDSITQGANDHDSYRRPLWQQLTNVPYNVDFVGSLNTNYFGGPPHPDFDLDHEGHWGWRADQILANITPWATAAQPDIVLIHLGSNDIFQGQTNASTITDLRNIIRALQAVNPQVKILLAQIIPHNQSGSPSVSGLNSLIPQLAADETTANSPVYVVDMATGFDPVTMTYDNVHPTLAGETFIANRWYAALTPLLSGATLPTNTPSPTRTNTSAVTPTPTRTATRTPTVNASASPAASATPTMTVTAGGASPTFYRAINLGGATIVVDGHTWEANTGTTPNFTTLGTAFCATWQTITPTTDANRTSMIQCSRQHWAHNAVMSGVPNGSYQVYVYTWLDWADPNPPAYSFYVQGQLVQTNYQSGPVGKWDRLGSWTANVTAGTITVQTNGGLANLSGIEVYALGSLPTSTASNTPSVTFTASITRTNTPTVTRTLTRTSTPTVSATPSKTLTPTVVPSQSGGGCGDFCETFTPSATSTETRTSTATLTVTPTATSTETALPTETNTPSATFTPSATNTATNTLTATLTATATDVPIETALPTDTGTPLPTSTASITNTATHTPTATRTTTATDVPTETALPTETSTPLPTFTSSSTSTATHTPTATRTTTATDVPTETALPTSTPSTTNTATSTSTTTLTYTPSVTASPSSTATTSNTPSPTLSPTSTATSGSSSPVFYRAVNMGGAAVVIDGHTWEANTGTTSNFTTNGTAFCNQWQVLTPATDANRASMIDCSRQHWAHSVIMSGVPNGSYQVFAYTWLDWADPNPPAYTFYLQGQSVQMYQSGPAGKWDRLGPWTVNVTAGTITLQTSGGVANLSGIEVYSLGALPPTATYTPSVVVTASTTFTPSGTTTGTATRTLTPTRTATSTRTSTRTPTIVPTLWNAYNLNGPQYTISNVVWKAGDASNGVTVTNGTGFCDQNVTLSPTASGNKARMIRCSYNANGTADMSINIANVPNGTYDVYLTVWENDAPTTFWLAIEGGQVYVPSVTTGAAGWWQRLGAYTVNVTDGNLLIVVGGGLANLSGVELFQR